MIHFAKNAFVAGFLATTCGIQLKADIYAITDLGLLEGTTQSSASAINNRGQVVGSSSIYPGGGMTPHRGFIYDGVMTQLGTLGGVGGNALAINNSGQVTGQAQTADPYQWNAYLYTPGTGMVDLGSLGGCCSAGFGVNDRGEVVGFSQIENSLGIHAFLYSGGVMNDIGTLGGNTSYAYGVNNKGQVVGESLVADGHTFHAFLFSDWVMTDLGEVVAYAINERAEIVGAGTRHAFLYRNDTTVYINDPDWLSSAAYGINNRGEVVGIAALADGEFSAFLYRGGVASIIQPSGWSNTVARAINDSGQIVGDGLSPDGQRHAFLLTPVPEPSSVLFLGSICLVFLALVRKRRARAASAMLRE